MYLLCCVGITWSLAAAVRTWFMASVLSEALRSSPAICSAGFKCFLLGDEASLQEHAQLSLADLARGRGPESFSIRALQTYEMRRHADIVCVCVNQLQSCTLTSMQQQGQIWTFCAFLLAGCAVYRKFMCSKQTVFLKAQYSHWSYFLQKFWTPTWNNFNMDSNDREGLLVRNRRDDAFKSCKEAEICLLDLRTEGCFFPLCAGET